MKHNSPSIPCSKKGVTKEKDLKYDAVREGFEPSVARLTTAVFKTAALVHYATSPKYMFFLRTLSQNLILNISQNYTLYIYH